MTYSNCLKTSVDPQQGPHRLARAHCVTRGGLDKIVLIEHGASSQAKACTGNCGHCAVMDMAAEGSPV